MKAAPPLLRATRFRLRLAAFDLVKTVMLRTSFISGFIALWISSAAAAETPLAVTVPAFSCATGKYAITLPPSLRKLRHMAPLVAEENPRIKEVGWEHYRVLHFPDLEVGITIDARKNRYVVEHLRISGRQWKVTGPLHVGASAAGILDSLGVAGPKDGVWKLWVPGPEQALLTVKAGSISEVSYNCYTG
jgi:hypothetical protein